MTRAARTNTHTYFFREPKAIAAVCEELIRPRARAGRSTSVWCIGCATGEEAYSLAIAAKQAAGDRFHIVASDLNPLALEHARRGRYLPRALRKVDAATLASSFESDADGGFSISDELRRRVSFVSHDVCSAALSPKEGKSFDVLFCRNVFLYLDVTSIRRAIISMSSVMSTKSVLVLGATEWLGVQVQGALPPELRLDSFWVRDVLCYRRVVGA
jgi:chemotaxis methyl-accepting protein methylase